MVAFLEVLDRLVCHAAKPGIVVPGRAGRFEVCDVVLDIRVDGASRVDLVVPQRVEPLGYPAVGVNLPAVLRDRHRVNQVLLPGVKEPGIVVDDVGFCGAVGIGGDVEFDLGPAVADRRADNVLANQRT